MAFGGLPKFNSDPYQQAKDDTRMGLSGLMTQGSRASQARLASRGLNRIPGVASDVATRQRYKFGGLMTNSVNKINMERTRAKESHDKWRAQMQFNIDQAKQSKSDSDRNLWIQGISTLIGAVATIYTGPVGGGIAKSGTEKILTEATDDD